jgi:hypothetical protein
VVLKNPIRAGWVKEIDNQMYSSTSDYARKRVGFIRVLCDDGLLALQTRFYNSKGGGGRNE